MRKISFAAVMLAACVSVASADFLSVSAGAGFWRENISGSLKKDSSTNYFGKHDVNPSANEGALGLEDKTQPYFWVKFIHPVPFIPNVKFQYTKYDSTGHSDYVAGNVKIGDVTINTALTNVDSSMRIDSYDFTFFYELKPVVVDLEAGFGFDYWDAHTTLTGTETTTGIRKTIVDDDWKLILPYLYGHAETMQFYGFSAIGNLKWLKVGDYHHYDYSVALKYTIDIVGPVNPFIKAGYRYKEIYGKDDGTEVELKYDGAFLEIGAKF
ncbi:MAG: TIGR04219 family outer membrane beta-barrel protein [Epsilonproteobacteria bacterium]|nr:TIGR04219 family outer membrane beta-barrel protein [Campylobacterota bacterium]